jgi:hypothetical protein
MVNRNRKTYKRKRKPLLGSMGLKGLFMLHPDCRSQTKGQKHDMNRKRS